MFGLFGRKKREQLVEDAAVLASRMVAAFFTEELADGLDETRDMVRAIYERDRRQIDAAKDDVYDKAKELAYAKTDAAEKQRTFSRHMNEFHAAANKAKCAGVDPAEVDAIFPNILKTVEQANRLDDCFDDCGR